MNAFLEKVLLDKIVEVEAGKARAPAEALLKDAPGPVRDFKAALRGGGASIIAEIKRRSPTVEAFPQGRRPPAELARLYEANGAAAVSMVTDAPRFGISLADVPAVREACSLPVLVKEFVIDPWQAAAARAAGADALLLIARIADLPTLRALYGYAREVGLHVLLECHDQADLEKAAALGAEVVGVNSRDLDKLTVSVEGARALLSSVPESAVRVAESGIRTRADVEAFARAGADAFLVGGALLSSPDPGALLRELRGAEPGGGTAAGRDGAPPPRRGGGGP